MSDPLTTFVVGPDSDPLVVRFHLVFKEGSPNIHTDDPLPPLNVHGLRRLARTLIALAELVEHAQGHRLEKH